MNRQYNNQVLCDITTRWFCAIAGIILVIIAFVMADNISLFLAMGAPLFVPPVIIVGVVMTGAFALSIAITGVI